MLRFILRHSAVWKANADRNERKIETVAFRANHRVQILDLTKEKCRLINNLFSRKRYNIRVGFFTRQFFSIFLKVSEFALIRKNTQPNDITQIVAG